MSHAHSSHQAGGYNYIVVLDIERDFLSLPLINAYQVGDP